MTLTLQQRWRLFLAGLHHSRQERELRQWLALKTATELRTIAANHSSPAVQAELRRRGLA
jgi:hypothetical protein